MVNLSHTHIEGQTIFYLLSRVSSNKGILSTKSLHQLNRYTMVWTGRKGGRGLVGKAKFDLGDIIRNKRNPPRKAAILKGD